MTEPENATYDDAVPEEADLGSAIQLEAGETLDGQPGTDAMDALTVAPERPFGLDDKATTADGQRDGDTLDERLTREIPDDVDAGDPAADDPAEDGLGADSPATDVVGDDPAGEAGAVRAGRLVADEVNPDTAATDVLDADDAGMSGGVATAEEAAMHEISEDDIQP